MNWLKKGQISLMATLIGAAGMLIASGITSYATVSNKIWTVQNEVNIVQERESNHYLELQKQLDNMNKKLDILIQKK